MFYAGWDLLGARELKPERRIDSKTLFDLVKLAFGVVAGAGALVALIVAYRRQRVDEDGALRDTTRLHTERFTTAVSQLGEESAAVRLGGVHALAGLADDAPTRDLRQTCIDVLCAYLRLPYTAETALPSDDPQARHTYLALREVRHTVIRLIRDHLCLDADHPHCWCGHDLNFTGTVFDGADFRGAVFSSGTVAFTEAEFSGGTADFRGVVFSGAAVDFCLAVFSGGTLDARGAKFSDGRIDFYGAEFSGCLVHFSRTEFSGSTVGFMSTVLSDGLVEFVGAQFSAGTVDFRGVVLSGGRLAFTDAVFSGSTVDFHSAEFSGSDVEFRRAKFSGGTVRFIYADFSGGTVSFVRARFSGGMVTFTEAEFSAGTVDFSDAVYWRGTVDFSDAEFSGGTVDFRSMRGKTPSGVVPPAGSPLPEGLILAEDWAARS
ncbi:pentapeptide repeat-containing protein [Streptomyces lasiicapitis]|uniref:pentapeptide repeat-containing protein n=1 Tax=Streptomyces lasiicapitis TaxID=1923961 RepID=UPI0033281A6F